MIIIISSRVYCQTVFKTRYAIPINQVFTLFVNIVVIVQVTNG